MVFSVVTGAETLPSMETEKPHHPLHNFNLPGLRWGTQRALRCMKIDPNSDPSITQNQDQRPQAIRYENCKKTVLIKEISAANDKEEEAVKSTGPWNLRSRKAFCHSPKSQLNHQRNGASVSVKREPKKLSLSLRKEEIEEDFLAMAGSKPPRRPKKRPKVIQQQLDEIFPGLGLSGITADKYKVADCHDSDKS
ncbi:hypothetical protein MRB53_031382 [Persea americana]|uniref:Uncharacterized protein n=1 Tax=Persea americana TaxID=3435 RepID=A0ACC2KNW6_PERAE|nr:hypothetical protein MRB53_031382 [Persea americana]